MPEPGYGEKQPRLEDGRLPVILLLLDGLGDRPLLELGGRTPMEAARTPVLDELARRGACGLHVPFGPGRAPASEVAHWAILGFQGLPFPGRAVLEALGWGLEVEDADPRLYVALRTSDERDGRIWISGRAGPGDEADAHSLLAGLPAPHGFELSWIRLGEAILRLRGAGPEAASISDSDPFFEDRQPWLRPRPHAGAGPPAAAAADQLAAYLRRSRVDLARHPLNVARRRRGLPALDTLTTKWAGARLPLPSFAERVGMRGGMVTSSALYRGFARLFGMEAAEPSAEAEPGRDIAARLRLAGRLMEEGAAFVHVHTKVVDEAAHSRLPGAKVQVLEALDRGLGALLERPFDAVVVAVTGDHATPSAGGVLHTGDPTPLLVTGGATRPDGVAEFGEEPCRAGRIGTLGAVDLLPYLLSQANRPRFLGARATAHETIGFPDEVEPLLPAD